MIITTLWWVVCLLGGCGTVSKTKETSHETKPDYSIGVVGANAPYYEKKEEGKASGMYVELMDALAKKEDFSYQFVEIDASRVKQDLENHTIDGFLGTFEEEKGQEDELSQTASFYVSKLCVATPKKTGIRKFQNIKNKEIAACGGTMEESLAKYFAVKYKAREVTFSSMEDVIADVDSGYSQLMVADQNYYEEHHDLLSDWNCLKMKTERKNSHRLTSLSDTQKEEGESFFTIFKTGIDQLKKEGTLQKITGTITKKQK